MSSSDAARQRSARRRRFGRWLPLTVIAVVLVALAAALVIRTGVTSANQSAATSSHWQTYHDPFGLYTLQLPLGWAAHYSTSVTSYGNRTVSDTLNAEMISFDDPSQGTGSAALYTMAYPIKTSSDYKYYCGIGSILQSFSSMSLNSMEHSGAVSLFETENAAFQIDAAIPSFLEPARFSGPLDSTPTPLPDPWLAIDKVVLNEMLVSFQPTNPTPITCG